MTSPSVRAATRSATVALAFTLVAFGLIRGASADRLVLVEPSGAVQAAVSRAVRETSLQLVVARGHQEEPRAIGTAQGARFVVWRANAEYVLLDLGTGQERRLRTATLDDEVTATALADDIVAWAVAAADIAPAPAETSALLAGATPELEAPRYRIELALGPRHNVAAREAVLASVNVSFLRRVGPVELGPTLIASEHTSRWQQTAYVVHVRLPAYGLADIPGTFIPRIGAGALLARATEPAQPGMTGRTGSGVWPVAELGLTLEGRRHRFAVGIDGGATFHLRQRLDAVPSVDITPHVEAAFLFRVGLLLY